MTRRDKKLRDRQSKLVAFGRTLPLSMRRKKFNEDLFEDLYEIICPEELSSLKIVFDSILHLGSTRALVDHLKENPDLPRAKFLVDNGMFDQKTAQKLQHQQTPLWTHFC